MIRNTFARSSRFRYLRRMWACVVLCTGWQAQAIEIRGLVDVRVGSSNADRNWTRDGLDKTRFDRDAGGIRLGQAFLRVDGEVMYDVSASVVASAGDDLPEKPASSSVSQFTLWKMASSAGSNVSIAAP